MFTFSIPAPCLPPIPGSSLSDSDVSACTHPLPVSLPVLCLRSTGGLRCWLALAWQFIAHDLPANWELGDSTLVRGVFPVAVHEPRQILREKMCRGTLDTIIFEMLLISESGGV